MSFTIVGGLAAMQPDECLESLRNHHVGRVSVVVDGQPLIFPVNYAMEGRNVVFRTDAGTKLFGAGGKRVAFEIDDADPLYHEGWSVLVVGIAPRRVGLAAQAAARATAAGAMVIRAQVALDVHRSRRDHGPASGPRTDWARNMTTGLNVLVLEAERGAAGSSSVRVEYSAHASLHRHIEAAARALRDVLD